MFYSCLRTRPQATMLICRKNLQVKGPAPASLVDPAIPAAPGGKNAYYSPRNRTHHQSSPSSPLSQRLLPFVWTATKMILHHQSTDRQTPLSPWCPVREPGTTRRQGSYLQAVTLLPPNNSHVSFLPGILGTIQAAL